MAKRRKKLMKAQVCVFNRSFRLFRLWRLRRNCRQMTWLCSPAWKVGIVKSQVYVENSCHIHLMTMTALSRSRERRWVDWPDGWQQLSLQCQAFVELICGWTSVKMFWFLQLWKITKKKGATQWVVKLCTLRATPWVRSRRGVTKPLLQGENNLGTCAECCFHVWACMSILLDVCIFVGWGGVRWDNNVHATLLPCFLHCTTYVILRCCYVVVRCSTYVMLRCCSVPLHCSLAL